MRLVHLSYILMYGAIAQIVHLLKKL